MSTEQDGVVVVAKNLTDERKWEIFKMNRDSLSKTIEKSEEDFEKNLMYVTAGTLVLSLTFIEKIVHIDQSKYIWVLILSWCSLAACLVIIVSSHYVNISIGKKLLSAYDSKDKEEALAKGIEKSSILLNRINIVILILILVGIGGLVTFCSLNANYMSKIETEIKPEKPDGGSKVRIFNPAIKPEPETKPGQTPPPPPPPPPPPKKDDKK